MANEHPAPWVNWNAATGQPYVADFCESELASEPLTAEWVNRMIRERYELLCALKNVMEWIDNCNPIFEDDPAWPIDRDAAILAIEKAEGGKS